MTKRLYLAGPMTGIANHNFPAFHEAAFQLRAAGYEVVNPAETNADLGGTWTQYLRRDIPLLCECDGVALLPGWLASRGAMLERSIAEALEMPIRVIADWLTAPEES